MRSAGKTGSSGVLNRAAASELDVEADVRTKLGAAGMVQLEGLGTRRGAAAGRSEVGNAQDGLYRW